MNITWQPIESSALCRLRWTERGGPRMAATMASRLRLAPIEQGLAQRILAEIEVDFAPAGRRGSIEASLHEIVGWMQEAAEALS